MYLNFTKYKNFGNKRQVRPIPQVPLSIIRHLYYLMKSELKTVLKGSDGRLRKLRYSSQLTLVSYFLKTIAKSRLTIQPNFLILVK